jgi:hypothetical protein|nr:MAG TPA: hypothetical protein [Caudoviricetes sp.]
MKIKEKCIYYNNARKTYYLVLSAKKEDGLIYGIYGETSNPSYLDTYLIGANSKGLVFKIGNITLNREHIRNYYFDDDELNSFTFIKELDCYKYSIIETLVSSNYKFPDTVIDVEKYDKDVDCILSKIQENKIKLCEIEQSVRLQERKLFKKLKQFEIN